VHAFFSLIVFLSYQHSFFKQLNHKGSNILEKLKLN
jgi:hypothetical protein